VCTQFVVCILCESGKYTYELHGFVSILNLYPDIDFIYVLHVPLTPIHSSMYGYHDTNQVFLKIFLYNPLLIKRLAELLLSGAILNRVMQPYEAHVPYILQV
jgi:hypothetical protein